MIIIFREGRHRRLALRGSPATARVCGELANGSPRRGRCRDRICFAGWTPSDELGRDGCSAATLQLSAFHDFMGISETILLSQYDAK